MAKMPGKVRVGTVTYRVTADPDEWTRFEHRERKSGFFGHSDHLGAVIYVCPDTPPDVQRLTLWHEVLHAAHCVMMGRLDWSDIGDTADDREETVIRRWEHPTLAVLRDNPKLAAYLLA